MTGGIAAMAQITALLGTLARPRRDNVSHDGITPTGRDDGAHNRLSWRHYFISRSEPGPPDNGDWLGRPRLVQGRSGASVIVAAAPVARWAQSRPPLERAVAAYRAR